MNKNIVLITSLSCLLFAPAVQSHLFGMGSFSETQAPAMDTQQQPMRSSDLRAFKSADLKDDARINQEVKKVLDADKNFAGVRADTREGVVTLSGTIDNQQNKRDILDKTKAVSGVKDVIDNITLSNQ